MNKRIQRLGIVVGIIVLVIIAIFIQYRYYFPLQEAALEDHINERFLISRNMDNADIDVNVMRDIGNYRTFLFSVRAGEATSSNPQLGFAFYERNRLGSTYRFDGMGWGTNSLDSYLFEANRNGRQEKLLVVYGRVPSDPNEYERFSVNFHDEVFVGNIAEEDYFVEVFTVTHETEDNHVTTIDFETADHTTESYPLIVTSKIK